MRIILFSALLLMLYSCGGSQKSYNQSYTPQPSFENLAKKYSDKELCERAYNVKTASSYSKSLTKEIKIRSLNCNSIFEAIAKKEREIEEKRIARLEEDHGFYCKWMQWLSEGTPEYVSCLENENRKKLASIANNKRENQKASDHSIKDPIIARYQSECIEMGFKKKTDKMADCILRQKDIETRKVAAKKLYDEEVRKNKAAEELAAKKRKSEKMRAAGELLTGISNSLLGSGSSSSYSSSSSSSQIKTACMFKDEVQKYGSLTKLCLYDCTGSVHSETINVVQMCPLISYK